MLTQRYWLSVCTHSLAALTHSPNTQKQNVYLNVRMHRREPHRRALPVPNKRQRREDTKWFAYMYILRATRAQMSGIEPVVCEKLPLHTYAGMLAITPASAGQRAQQPTRRETTAADWGTTSNPRYSGDEEYTSMRVPGLVDQRPRTEIVIRTLVFFEQQCRQQSVGHGWGGLHLGNVHDEAHAESSK